MDIIIRDVEEKDGQYKIYNKDGTGGHWYITKESAEVVSSTAEVRRLPEQKPRVETGVTVFGDDWQGLFLRGDYCADLLGKLSKLLNGDISPIEKEIIYEFHELLKKVKE